MCHARAAWLGRGTVGSVLPLAGRSSGVSRPALLQGRARVGVRQVLGGGGLTPPPLRRHECRRHPRRRGARDRCMEWWWARGGLPRRPPSTASATLSLQSSDTSTALQRRYEAFFTAVTQALCVAVIERVGSELDSEPNLTICWVCFFWPKPMNLSTVK